MPWVVGIDEAGYGPNLGPLVQAAAAMELPAADVAGWETLRGVVRRSHEPEDGRLLVDDSKKVYAAGVGLANLERAVLAGPAVFAEWLRTLMPGASVEELAGEGWFDGGQRLGGEEPNPPAPFPEREGGASGFPSPSLLRGGGRGEGFLPFARLTPTPRFNRLVAECGSKGTVLARGLIDLLAASAAAIPGEPLLVLCDKQGGRNFYAAILQEAFPDGWVVADREGAAESRYRVLNVGRDITVVFRPRADGDSVCVALASMLAKYLREVCMGQFNAYWCERVPGLLPTAGYPLDARRFYAAIRPAMEQLGVPHEAVWRVK